MDQVFSLVLQCVKYDVEDRDHSWATEAHDRLEKELAKLDHYYQSCDTNAENKDSTYQTDEATSHWSIQAEQELRRAELIWRTEPKIEVRPQQMALVYLATPPA